MSIVEESSKNNGHYEIKAKDSDPSQPTSKVSSVQSQNEPTPNQTFMRMVMNDAKQNRRLSSRLSQASIERDSTMKGNEPDKGSKMRFVVCTLGLLSLTMSNMSRMVLNLSITSMVDPSMLAHAKNDNELVSADGSCPWPEEELLEVFEAEQQQANLTSPQPEHIVNLDDTNNVTTTVSSVEMIEDTTVSDGGETTQQVSDSNATTTSSDQHHLSKEYPYPRFKWTIKQQNMILGGFYYSYFVFMVLGGRMAEIYGAKYVLLLSVAGSAIINLATPWMAETSFVLMVMSRVVMGAIQSGVFPGMYALIAKWLTMSEASIYAPLIKMNLRLGMVMGTLVPGLVAGWPNVYYFTGALNAIWSIVWLFVASSTPAENRWVTKSELQHIMRKKRKPKEEHLEIEMDIKTTNKGDHSKQPTDVAVSAKKASTTKTPWLTIITAPSVIGLIVVKLTFNYALDFLAIELPSYLKYVHHASRQKISAITTSMFSIQVFLIVFVGWLAKVMVQRRPFGLSKTSIRKLFQSMASLGMGISLFLLTFNGCNLTIVTILLLTISFLAMFTAGGETMLPYDLSDEYPATIMAIANSIGNVSGITTTALAAFILGGNHGASYDHWNILIYLIAAANLIGGMAFVLLVKAEPIDFSSSDADTKTNNKGAKTGDSKQAAARGENGGELPPSYRQIFDRHDEIQVEAAKNEPSHLESERRPPMHQ